MVQANIEEKIIKTLKEDLEFQVDFEDISKDETFIKLGLDSLSYVKLIVLLEEKFGIEFDDSLLNSNEATMQDIIEFIVRTDSSEEDLN